MSSKELIAQVVSSPKAAIAVSTATAGTGIGTLIDAIPAAAGVFATLAGAILSIILARYWIVKTKFMIEAERERRDNARRRALRGEDVRRADD